MKKFKTIYVFVMMTAFAMGLSGCSSLSYYAHVMNGHHELMEAEEDIKVILAEKKYPEATRTALRQALDIRQFASQELDLPDNESYTTFVKLDRPYPIWNVIAAERFSIQAKQWCFLIVGCIAYRGYFNEQDAEAKARELQAEGYDVAVSPAAAYSTLGWFDDALLSSMLYKDNARLAGIIFHELAHQKVYINDDSAFNEAFATAVELEGVRRWLASQGDQQGIKRYRLYKLRQREFNRLLHTTRQRLMVLYESETGEAALSTGKANIIAEMKRSYKKIKRTWGGYDGYDTWMQRDINNAHLALAATYHELVPAFEALLEREQHHLGRFYASVQRLGELPAQERAHRLIELKLVELNQ